MVTSLSCDVESTAKSAARGQARGDGEGEQSGGLLWDLHGLCTRGAAIGALGPAEAIDLGAETMASGGVGSAMGVDGCWGLLGVWSVCVRTWGELLP